MGKIESGSLHFQPHNLSSCQISILDYLRKSFRFVEFRPSLAQKILLTIMLWKLKTRKNKD